MAWPSVWWCVCPLADYYPPRLLSIRYVYPSLSQFSPSAHFLSQFCLFFPVHVGVATQLRAIPCLYAGMLHRVCVLAGGKHHVPSLP